MRAGDIEYESANFLYWSKREIVKRFPQHEQLGFGICANDELHGDIEYYYVVEHLAGATFVRAFAIEHDGGPTIGRCVRQVAVSQPLFSSSSFARPMKLPKVRLNGAWYLP
ncbi:MAG TPA: hypothetical protein VNA69_05920 [Thermoanaerobaculia bacterium]|nr:hypothetical protein [Thermoanaerobaculia bacterium]